jgi:hypothetical protein
MAGTTKHTPGAKAQCFCSIERPKAKALGYLDAKTDSLDTSLLRWAIRKANLWRRLAFSYSTDSWEGEGV